jgi:hypothetical protein
MIIQTDRKGYLLLGDVHALWAPFKAAVDHAVLHDLDVISIGDLIDNNEEGDMVVEAALDLIDAGRMHVICGNHERKIFRHLNGEPVHIGWPNRVTLDHFNRDPEYRTRFLQLYPHLVDFVAIENPLSPVYITHAGMLPNFWEGEITDETRQCFLYGQADLDGPTYQYLDQVYHRRVYNWCDAVPYRHVIYVGHDPTPMEAVPKFDDVQSEPLVYNNTQEGEVVFMDTGCGKGGMLTGAVLSATGERIEFVNFGK